jgi:hypothetical protein
VRFGLFIPQGWRLDLVDIPTDNHWQVMRDLANIAAQPTVTDQLRAFAGAI